MTGKPKRILHVVRAMNRGGVEMWLMNVLRKLDRNRIHMDFLVHTHSPCAYDEEILATGSRLFRCTAPLWSPDYIIQLARFLRQSDPYDVIHSHVHHFSGYLMALARRLQIRSRIAHSHNDTSGVDRAAGWVRRQYLGLTEHWIRGNATRLVAVSRAAAQALFGAGWESDPRSVLLRCGIDLEPFRRGSDRRAMRAQLNIGDHEYVIGHVGRFDLQKNHGFLIQIAAEAFRRNSQTRLLLVGDGPLRNLIEEQSRQAGIGDKVIFAGVRGDVPRLLGAVDVIVLPSLWEGIPLVLLEAQAAGLPCIISDVISEEADVIPSLLRRKSLSASPHEWAASALAARDRAAPNSSDALALMESSCFSISSSLDRLYALYGA